MTKAGTELASARPAEAHAPLPYDTLEIGALTASGSCHIYLTDATGRKIAAIWGKANEKAWTAALIVAAVNERDSDKARLRVMEEALREAADVLALLTKPEMKVSAGSIYFRAVAAETKARSALPSAGESVGGA